MDKWFFKGHKFLSKNKLASAIGLLLLLSGLLLLVNKIRFEEDISKLIPINSENQDIQKVFKSVNFTDKIIVNIKRQEAADIDELIQYAVDFTDSLEINSKQYINNIRGKVEEDNLMQTMDFVYGNLPLFLEKEDYTVIENKIHPDSIAAICQANFRTLISPSGIVSKETILRDPLGLSFIALRKLRQLGVSDDFVLKEGFLVSKDERNILLFISPKYGSSETAKNTKFAQYLYELRDDLDQKYSGKVKSEYFGAALIAVANAAQIKNDVSFTVGITFTLLIVIFMLFYRKLFIPLILFVPTFFGGLLAMAVLFLVRNEISAISLGIGSVLIGVTLDYALHILTHIRHNASVKELYQDLTKPLLMSGLTTALAFLCLLFIDSQALQDLGIFAAVSIIGAVIFALLFIPLVYKGQSRLQRKNILDSIAEYPFHRKKILLIGFSILLIISIFNYSKVGFDKDISKLNYVPEEIQESMQHLDELTDLSSKSIYLATYGKSVEGTLQVNDSIHGKLEILQSKELISGFSSIGVLVNSKRDQRQKIAQWQEFWSDENKEDTQNNLISSGQEIGFKPSTFNQFYDFLDTDFETLEPEDYQKIPSMLLEDFISTDTDFTTITTVVKLKGENNVDIKQWFKMFPNTVVIDRKEMNEVFLGNLRSDFNILIAYCIIVVLSILYLFFRSFSLTLVTVAPIFITWFITLGIMGLVGMDFNIFNIIVTTFIFGLGIDYSIFMTKGLQDQLKTGEKVVVTYKTSVLLSVLTTILGIGVLVLAKHPALYSISVVSIIGISTALLTSFTVQPLLFKLFIGSRKRPPIQPRMFVHSVLSFGYFGLGGILVSLFSVTVLPLATKKNADKYRFHKIISLFMKSVLYTNPFVKKRILNAQGEDFSKPAIIIANHTSFLDILAIGMLHPKICFLVNDWVYHSPIFGKVVQQADFFPVSKGIENSMPHLQRKIAQGYSLMAFPEGTRSESNKIRRFHKGAFYLAEQFKLDILPILIHGNSEVNPKGSFIIKDGSITLEILSRIPHDDPSFGMNYTQRAKKVGAYFRDEFYRLRLEMEKPSYFHNLVLQEYRYKGNKFFRSVKIDLKEFEESYFEVLVHLPQKSRIAHFSEEVGQLEFLMSLHGPTRKIYSVVEDPEILAFLKKSYLTNKNGNLHFVPSSSQIELKEQDAVLISSEKMASELALQTLEHVKIIILLKHARSFEAKYTKLLKHRITYSDANIVIFDNRAELLR